MKIDYILDTKVDFHNETLQIEFRKATEVLSRWVFDTRDRAFRDALIKLSWSPPNRERSLDILDEANKELATKLRDVTAERDKLRELLASAHHEQFVNGYILPETWHAIHAALRNEQQSKG